MREKILYLISRYQNEARGLAAKIEEESDGLEKEILKARKYTYEMKMIKDLKRLIESETKTATIWMKFPGDDEEYEYGTYAFNTAAEKNSVNEIALTVQQERDCQVEVRVNE